MKELFQQKLIKIAAIAVLIIIAVVVISLSSGYFSTTPVILRTPLQSQYGKPLTTNPKIEGEDVLLRFEIKLAKMKTKKILLKLFIIKKILNFHLLINNFLILNLI